MRSHARALALSALLSLTLSACGTVGGGRPVSDMPVKIGKPYTVRGITYVPARDDAYDQVGYASWYGHESGNITANGERFRPKGVSAAHKTLPLPSYAEVTALDTGRTILVRINDRGPFAAGRIIDLSKGAAEQLGIVRQGTAAVRVIIVTPPEKDRAALRKGEEARPRSDMPSAQLDILRARLANASKDFAASAIVANERP